MKILGYLLEDRTIGNGSSAADIFCRRTGDETLKGAVSSVGSKFDSDVLMFQIGAKENKAKAESISEIIYREFSKDRGYAGTPWVAKIEKDLEQQGVYEEFKKIIKDQTGTIWEQRRTQSIFVRKDLIKALVEVQPEFTEDDARQAIEDVKEGLVITPETLTEELLEYIENKNGNGTPRYFVFLDEISQFIGEDSEKLRRNSKNSSRGFSPIRTKNPRLSTDSSTEPILIHRSSIRSSESEFYKRKRMQSPLFLSSTEAIADH